MAAKSQVGIAYVHRRYKVTDTVHRPGPSPPPRGAVQARWRAQRGGGYSRCGAEGRTNSNNQRGGSTTSRDQTMPEQQGNAKGLGRPTPGLSPLQCVCSVTTEGVRYHRDQPDANIICLGVMAGWACHQMSLSWRTRGVHMGRRDSHAPEPQRIQLS